MTLASPKSALPRQGAPCRVSPGLAKRCSDPLLIVPRLAKPRSAWLCHVLPSTAMSGRVAPCQASPPFESFAPRHVAPRPAVPSHASSRIAPVSLAARDAQEAN